MKLVTGGAGFIGSHLVDELLRRGSEEVCIIDNFSTGRRDNLQHLADSPNVRLLDIDVRDSNQVPKLVEEANCVYHLAGAVGVERVIEDPIRAFETNVHGTENILKASSSDTPVFIASTSEVYGKSHDLPFSEGDDRLMGDTTVPRWGYATAKAADEFLSLSYADRDDIPVVIARLFNVVGPRQTGDYGMVLPTFVRQARNGEPITVYGDGAQTRCFAHVSDVTTAICDLVNAEGSAGEVYNVGAETPVTIEELAERVVEIVDSSSPIVHVSTEEAFNDDFEEPKHRRPSIEKLRATLDTVPATSLDQIISDVAESQRGDA